MANVSKPKIVHAKLTRIVQKANNVAGIMEKNTGFAKSIVPVNANRILIAKKERFVAKENVWLRKIARTSHANLTKIVLKVPDAAMERVLILENVRAKRIRIALLHGSIHQVGVSLSNGNVVLIRSVGQNVRPLEFPNLLLM